MLESLIDPNITNIKDLTITEPKKIKKVFDPGKFVSEQEFELIAFDMRQRIRGGHYWSVFEELGQLKVLFPEKTPNVFIPDALWKQTVELVGSPFADLTEFYRVASSLQLFAPERLLAFDLNEAAYNKVQDDLRTRPTDFSLYHYYERAFQSRLIFPDKSVVLPDSGVDPSQNLLEQAKGLQSPELSFMQLFIKSAAYLKLLYPKEFENLIITSEDLYNLEIVTKDWFYRSNATGIGYLFYLAIISSPEAKLTSKGLELNPEKPESFTEEHLLPLRRAF